VNEFAAFFVLAFVIIPTFDRTELFVIVGKIAFTACAILSVVARNRELVAKLRSHLDSFRCREKDIKFLVF
jgi:hypothetical protein